MNSWLENRNKRGIQYHINPIEYVLNIYYINTKSLFDNIFKDAWSEVIVFTGSHLSYVNWQCLDNECKNKKF